MDFGPNSVRLFLSYFAVYFLVILCETCCLDVGIAIAIIAVPLIVFVPAVVGVIVCAVRYVTLPAHGVHLCIESCSLFTESMIKNQGLCLQKAKQVVGLTLLHLGIVPICHMQ